METSVYSNSKEYIEKFASDSFFSKNHKTSRSILSEINWLHLQMQLSYWIHPFFCCFQAFKSENKCWTCTFLSFFYLTTILSHLCVLPSALSLHHFLSSRWVQVLPEEAALHSLPAHQQCASPVGQWLGPSGSLQATPEFPGDPAAQDPAHCPQALWPQHPLSPQPQPPDA